MTGTHEAFLLLALSDVELAAPGTHQRGTLELECITVPAAPTARDVFLVLRLNSYETVVDPERQITLHVDPNNGARTYVFHRTVSDPAEITVRLSDKAIGGYHAADVETFDSVLEQYAVFTPGAAHIEPTPSGDAYNVEQGKEDLRGRLVLVDQDNGEVLGTIGDRVHADPQIFERGHEHDPVVIDVGPSNELEAARDIFVRAIPPHEHNLLTRGASMLSTGISGATTLVVKGITAASNAYIARATPHPSAAPARDGQPRAPPPRAVTWLTSEATRSRMATAHTYTGKAVQVSGKTITMVESLIARAVGGTPSSRPKKRQALADIPAPGPSYAPTPNGSPYVPTPNGSPYVPTPANSPYGAHSPPTGIGSTRTPPPPANGAPGPYGGPYPPQAPLADERYPSSHFYNRSPTSSTAELVPPPPYASASGRLTPPPLPARKGARTPSPGPPPAPASRPLPPRMQRYAEGGTAKPGLKDKAVLSTYLVLSTIDDSLHRLIDVGSERIPAVVGHKYGAEAGASARVLTGTARNVGVVYIDISGLGHRALLKTAGKQWIKAQVRGKEVQLRTDSSGQVVQAQPVEK